MCLFPLVKGIKDPSLTECYRAVAGSSIILKLFDYVLLNILQSDSLQFGYKRSTSTTECSWLVMTVADYFRRRGSPVYCATMDAKQGFDRCSWPVIFSRLRKRGMPAVVTRNLMYVYIEQSAVVKGATLARNLSVSPMVLGRGQLSLLHCGVYTVRT